MLHTLLNTVKQDSLHEKCGNQGKLTFQLYLESFVYIWKLYISEIGTGKHRQVDVMLLESLEPVQLSDKLLKMADTATKQFVNIAI